MTGLIWLVLLTAGPCLASAPRCFGIFAREAARSHAGLHCSRGLQVLGDEISLPPCPNQADDAGVTFVDAKTGQVAVLLRVDGLGGKTGQHPQAALNRKLVDRFRKLKLGAATVASGE